MACSTPSLYEIEKGVAGKRWRKGHGRMRGEGRKGGERKRKKEREREREREREKEDGIECARKQVHVWHHRVRLIWHRVYKHKKPNTHTHTCMHTHYMYIPLHLVKCIFSEWMGISKANIELMRCCLWAYPIQYLHHPRALLFRPHFDG